MSKITQTREEQIVGDIEKKDRQYRKRRIDEAIQEGYQKLHDDDLAGLCVLMRDILIPDMGVARHTLRDHAETVQQENADLRWDHTSVRSFVERPDSYHQAMVSPEPESEKELAGQLYMKAAGVQDPRERKRKVVRQAFQSLESLAVARGFVSNSVTNWAPAFGYELQLGTWYQPPRDDMPFEIQLVTPGDSEEVTVNMGKPGRGKGVMGHTEAEDRYAAGRNVIDLVDFDECEGAVYDIPNRNPTLREAREEMGLEPDFTEVDGYEPNLEIMVPMTENLADEYIPYYGDGGTDTVVKPFTVPASHLSKKALKRFIASELTDTQKNIFETAYDQIQRSRDDWNLHDLIMAVERQRGVHGNQGAVDRVQRSIKRIQAKGWIRDEDDPNAIDWERILTDSDTITVFTASKMPDTDEAAQYLFHSYLLYAFRKELKRVKGLPAEVKEQRGWRHVPKIQSILRELHEIAPNNETSSDDETIREIQEAMTSDFRNLTAMHRHEGVEVSADTQNFIGEIKKRARVNFNRAALFSVDFNPASAMFQQMAGEPRDKYPRTVTRNFGVGECAVLGRVGTGRSFEMTVKVAPPMSHHFDPDEWVHPERKVTKSRGELKKELGADPEAVDHDWVSVNSGWDLRVHLLDEEFRKASELLDAVNAGDAGEDMDLNEVKTEQKRPEDGVGKFAWDALEIDSDSRLILDRLEFAYQAYAEQHDEVSDLSRQAITKRLGTTLTPETEKRTFGDVTEHGRPVIDRHPDGRRQTSVYYGVELQDAGEWMNCCDAPEFQLTWTDDGDGKNDRGEPNGWTCANCHGEGTPSEQQTLGDAPEDGKSPDGPDTEPPDPESEGEERDPAVEDMDCCSYPTPTPMYAGEENDEMVGFQCQSCGAKEWN